MKQTDEILLEKAYLSISKPVPGPKISSEEEVPQLDDIDTDVDSHIDDGSEMMGDVSEPTDMAAPVDSSWATKLSAPEYNSEECEEDEMVISNLDSVRESITKIASFCASGGHLESWQQQKLAIAMDNLAEVARRIRH